MNRKYRYPLVIAINILLCPTVIPVSTRQFAPPTGGQQPVDSSSVYLKQAAHNNPQVNVDFMLYKTSLERTPQAGAFSDPESGIGLSIKPMETLMDKQVADFTLVQMLPWFGTRRAARGEVSEMTHMAYEQLRGIRGNLWYEVKAQWYQLCSLNGQYRTMKINIHLLCQLEQLALNRFSASSAQTTSLSVSSSSSAVRSISSMPLASASGNDVAGMGGMGNAASAIASGTSIGTSSGGMSGVGGGSMGSTATGSISDVLRTQMEHAELEGNLAAFRSTHLAAETRFDALLGRPSDILVHVPDSLTQRFYRIDKHILIGSILTHNPTITMPEAKGEAFRAKTRMERRMSYPTIGIGLQYSLINKMADLMGMPDMNGKSMVIPVLKISPPLFRRKYSTQ